MSGFPCHILNPDATEEQVLGLEGGGEARQERLADEGQAWPACRGTPPFSGLWTILAGRTFGETSHPPTRVQEDGVRGSSFVKAQTLTASRSLRDHLFTASSVAVLRLLGCQSIKLLTLAETRSRECSRDVFPAAETTFQPPFGSNSLACVHTRRDCCHP